MSLTAIIAIPSLSQCTRQWIIHSVLLIALLHFANIILGRSKLPQCFTISSYHCVDRWSNLTRDSFQPKIQIDDDDDDDDDDDAYQARAWSNAADLIGVSTEHHFNLQLATSYTSSNHHQKKNIKHSVQPLQAQDKTSYSSNHGKKNSIWTTIRRKNIIWTNIGRQNKVRLWLIVWEEKGILKIS